MNNTEFSVKNLFLRTKTRSFIPTLMGFSMTIPTTPLYYYTTKPSPKLLLTFIIYFRIFEIVNQYRGAYMNNNTQTTITQLKEELIPIIKSVVHEELKANITVNIEEFIRQNELRAKELSILERIVRVEEELKALRQTMEIRFESMEKRFEARFESMEKRFTALQWFMGIGFTIISILIAVFGLFVGKV